MVTNLVEEHKEAGFSPRLTPLLIFQAEAASHMDKPDREYVPVCSHPPRATGLSRETGPRAPVTAVTR